MTPCEDTVDVDTSFQQCEAGKRGGGGGGGECSNSTSNGRRSLLEHYLYV